MRIFVSAAVLVSLFACGSSTGSDEVVVPEVTDNVVAPTAAYAIAMKCFSGMASWGSKATVGQLDCCKEAGCAPTTVTKTNADGSIRCYQEVCDCGLGKAGGTKQEDYNDTTYLASDCR